MSTLYDLLVDKREDVLFEKKKMKTCDVFEIVI